MLGLSELTSDQEQGEFEDDADAVTMVRPVEFCRGRMSLSVIMEMPQLTKCIMCLLLTVLSAGILQLALSVWFTTGLNVLCNPVNDLRMY